LLAGSDPALANPSAWATGLFSAELSKKRRQRKESTLLGLVFSSSLIVSLLLYGLWDACYTLTIINGISLRQMVTPDHLQGRVNATARMIAWGGTPFGAAIGGILAQALDIRLTYLIMAESVALSALVGWFSPRR
jgi:hypothetical protein